MNINLTLVGQMFTFTIFVVFTMKYVWPPIVKALNDRKSKIADGLAAAERGHHELALSQERAKEQLKKAKEHANEIIDKANKRGSQIVEEAKGQARVEGKRLLEVAQAHIDQEVTSAKTELKQQIAVIAISGAEKILNREIDVKSNTELVNNLIKEM